MGKIIPQGRLLFGIAIAASGAEGLICARLRLPIHGVPWFPANQFLEYFYGVILLTSGLCVSAGVRVRLFSSLLGILFVVFATVNEFPQLLATPLDLSVRTVFFEALAIAAAAITLAGTLRSGESKAWPSNRFVDALCASGPFLFAICLIVFGIDHFLILDFIASLVPAWLPWHLFWAYLTGAAFVVGGISIAVKWLDLWAGFCLGMMFATWFLILHSPRVLMAFRSHNPNTPDEWSSACIALAMCGGCWICAFNSMKRRQILKTEN